MVTKRIILERPERFEKIHTIPRAKLLEAAKRATDKLRTLAEKYGNTAFPGTCSKDYAYACDINKNWECGMYTGCYWLAYLLTGDGFFRRVAEEQTATYRRRIDEKIGMDDHDVGFVFTPSCVAEYRTTGNPMARELALEACEYFYGHSYSKEGRFIIRSWKSWDKGSGCRTMMDSLMNAPLLFWAAGETGKQEYYTAALEHVKTTERYLIREDGSSFHHYQFDPVTAAPVRGVTLQGLSDDSTWSRGHSWGIYGFPIAYSYTKEPFLKELHKNVTYYMLNKLPEDLIPHWDYDLAGTDAPRDSSAGACAVCGMLEMASHLSAGSEDKRIFESASAQMLESIIGNCTGDIGREYDGLICHVTHAHPQGQGIDECAVYGDFFYLEALARYILPDFKKFW